MGWAVEIEPEVAEWLLTLNDADFTQTTAVVDRLSKQGNLMRMPFSRSLKEGLFELRYSCGGLARRITYWLGAAKTIVLLTTFRKQRNNEHQEVEHARAVMQRCKNEHMNRGRK